MRYSQGCLQSRAFTNLLHKLTELDVVSCGGEVRRFAKGHYTLLHDMHDEPHTLDVVFSCTPVWDETWGGAVNYVAEGADEELLTSMCGRAYLRYILC